MHNVDLILTLTSGLTAALLLGYVSQRMGLSPIVGYLLAGIAVGPHTPGLVADQQLAEQMAEIGVILLMFGVGLHFHLDELLAVRRIAIPGAIVTSLVATLLGLTVARAFGWSWSAGIVFGLTVSVASTVVLVRILTDHRDLHTPAGHVAVGWVVVEDLFTVFALVLLPALFGRKEAAPGEVAIVIAFSGLKIVALAAIVLVAGKRLIPWLLERTAATGSRELFTLTVLVVALGIAVGAAKLFGVSMALGAFLGGMVVGRSDFSQRAASEALPMRDAFAVLFFVSVGMLLSPRELLALPGLFFATLAVVLVGKPLAALAMVLLLRYPPQIALGVAVSLAQIGEFSFILGSLGRELNILSADATNTLVAVAIVSITLNPLLYRAVDPAIRLAARWPRFWKMLNSRAAGADAKQIDLDEIGEKHRAVVIGYGPVGRTVARLLRENDIEPTIIEMNLDTVRSLREQGIAAVYGDATHRDTLVAAGVPTASSLILSSAGMQHSQETIRLARELNPDIHILARAAFVREMPALQKAGAENVYSGEGEVALAFTVATLRDLGATPEQIDRERERVYSDLFGTLHDTGKANQEPSSPNTEAEGSDEREP